MKINLKQIFDIVGESKKFGYEIAAEELQDVKGFTFSTPVSLEGRFYNRAGVVYLEYSAIFEILHICDRCLKEFSKNYDLSFEHIVVPSVSNSDNDDYIVADGESIEVNEIALTDILLSLPTKILCKEDCKGLCMVCGCDLNETQCDHLNNNEL
ncbi:DUF177 domain-containing protein [Ruminococcus sp.]|uniref:YceD family protein n=1 Tax=Ruminococcus sp. TaxID=41978 RepID=UPI0025D2A936|nr:DUF177 domain-containing protein [Ruminococcus sp.]MBQ6252713.1 DUF177 domain-containing protein [Ruminococcus sp.]MBR0511781.1 DUF177 domain-containing protein [Ruminococcus sp.]